MTRPQYTGDLAKALNDHILEVIIHRYRKMPEDIERAFRNTPRHYFLPGRDLYAVYIDDAIGTGWTEDGKEATSSSSQPSLMAIMLVELDVRPDHRVLEIGTGTGYNAALLASLTGNPLNVYTVDISQEYSDRAKKNLESQGTSGINAQVADGWHGWPDAAPYDRIIVTAGAYDIAPAWFDQLKDGGRLVLPFGNPVGQYRLMTFEKRHDSLELAAISYCEFMRMRGEYDWRTRAPLASVIETGDAGAAQDAQRVALDPSLPATTRSWDDLAFYLSLYLWPWVVVVSSPPDDEAKKFLIILDSDSGRQITVRCPDQWIVTGSTDESRLPFVVELMQEWFAAGQPLFEHLRMSATKRPANSPPASSVQIAAREWFDYHVSWAPYVLG